MRSGPTDQFAVLYTFDLSKVKVSTEPQQSQPQGTLTGQAKLGAGADADSAVVALGIYANMSDASSSGTLKGEFSAAVNTKQELLKLSTVSTMNMAAQAEDGTSHSVRGTVNGLVSIQAGAKPSISLNVNGNSNMTLPQEGQTQVSDADHSFDVNLKLVKLSNQEIGIDYTTTVDGKTESGHFNLSNDSGKTCETRSVVRPVRL